MSKTATTFVLDKALIEERAYWVERLSCGLDRAAPNPLIDQEPPAYAPPDAQQITIRLPAATATSLRQITRNSDLLVYTALVAALKVAIYRYTGETLVVTGSPALQQLAAPGDTPNAVTIMDRLDPDQSFRALLLQIRATLNEAYTRQRYPIDRLLLDLGLPQSAPVYPLFSIVVALEALHGPLPDVYPAMTIIWRADQEQISATITYDRQRVATQRIEHFTEHLIVLLQGMLAQPTLPIARIPLLTDHEYQRLVVDTNATSARYPSDSCVHTLFEAQAAQTPDALAVVCGQDSLTYRQLNDRADELAVDLRELGIGPDCLVGLFAERSTDLVVGLLGILKAGGAYVPIDPSYPRERVTLICQAAHMPVLVTQQALVERLPDALQTDAQTVPRVVCVDRPRVAPATRRLSSPTVHPDHLAYVIYTSGSTGQPKGVLISHRSAANYLHWCRQRYPLTRGGSTPVHSSIAFDMPITSLLAPLVAGERVVLMPEDAGAEVLGQLLQEDHRFSLIKLTPAHMHLLGQMFAGQQMLGYPCALVIGGENLMSETVAQWQALAPETRLFNEYGPTETTVGCCVYEVPRDREHQGAIPIGRPISNMQIYLLNTELQLVPVGVAGELYIGGVQLARGYVNRPDLTAERFIPSPFSEAPGQRLYRTGDQARYLADGTVEFLGRLDQQVKVRGFRVEPGEIEAVLLQHPVVRQAVVIAHDDRSGQKQLTAYVVENKDPAETGEPENNSPNNQDLGSNRSRLSILGSTLRNFLKERLPDYLLPAAIVRLDALPLTLNGKLDRRALPPPTEIQLDQDVPYVPPRTELEQTIATIWQATLGVERVGRNDNFFDLGGHSLLMVQVHHQIRAALQADLSLIEMFRLPTISDLADHLSRSRSAPPSFEQNREAADTRRAAIRRRREFRQRNLAASQHDDEEEL